MRLAICAKCAILSVILFAVAINTTSVYGTDHTCSSGIFTSLYSESSGYGAIEAAHKSTVTDFAFDCSRQILLTVADDGFIRIWSLETGVLIMEIDGEGGEIWNIDLQPDGPCFATSHQDGTVKLWNLDTGELMNSWQAHREAAYYVFWIDSETVRSGSCVEAFQYCEHGQTRKWNLKGELLESENTSQGWSWWGDLAPDNSTWASTSCADRDLNSYCLKGEVLIWNNETGERTRLATDSDTIIYGDYSPDSKTIVVSTFFFIRPDTSPQIILFDAATGRQIWKIEDAHTYSVNMVKFHPNGRLFASASFDGTVKLWTSSGNLIKTLNVPADNIRSLRFHPQDDLLFVGTCLQITSTGCTQGDILIHDVNEFID
jgi:WD40 repeat protein